MRGLSEEQEAKMTIKDKATRLADEFSWFPYNQDKRKKFIEELLTYDHARIEEAYKWYFGSSYDYMAYGEWLSHAIDYIKGVVDKLW